MRRLAVALSSLALLAGCGGGRTLELPVDALRLREIAAQSRDAADLYHRLREAGYSRVRASLPDDPGGTWTPESSESLLQFWRHYTAPATAAADGTRIFPIQRLKKSGRPLGLDEPPALVALTAAGDALSRAGNLRGAIKAWGMSQKQAPGLPLFQVRLGDARLQLREYREAERAYGKAFQLAGPHPDIFGKLGELLEAERRPREAEDAFLKAAGLDPDNPARWVRLAQSRKAQGRASSALEALARALALDPRNAPALELKDSLEEAK